MRCFVYFDTHTYTHIFSNTIFFNAIVYNHHLRRKVFDSNSIDRYRGDRKKSVTFFLLPPSSGLKFPSPPVAVKTGGPRGDTKIRKLGKEAPLVIDCPCLSPRYCPRVSRRGKRTRQGTSLYKAWGGSRRGGDVFSALRHRCLPFPRRNLCVISNVAATMYRNRTAT